MTSLFWPVSLRVRALAALPALAVLAIAGCTRDNDAAARRRAERALLERQVAGLRQLALAAEEKRLVSPGQILIGVDERTVRELLNAALPRDQPVAERFRVRVDRAEVEFSASQGVVRAHGRVSDAQAADTWAELELSGSLDRLAVDAPSGRLLGHVAIDRFEVRRAAAAGAESRLARSLIQAFAGERLESLQALLPELEIPIKLEQTLHIDGLGAGPLAAAPGLLPIRLAVARVIPLSGRLWIVLDAAAGPWQRSASTASVLR